MGGLKDIAYVHYFQAFGRVVDAYVVKHKATGRPRGWGYVTFESPSAVDKVLAQSLHVLSNGQRLRCFRRRLDLSHKNGSSSPERDRWDDPGQHSTEPFHCAPSWETSASGKCCCLVGVGWPFCCLGLGRGIGSSAGSRSHESRSHDVPVSRTRVASKSDERVFLL